MRNQFALAFVLATIVAAPARGQRQPALYHGAGYEIALPAGCRPMLREESEGDETIQTEMAGFECGKGAVIVARLFSDRLADTTLATRRAMMQLTRAGMLSAAGDGAVWGQSRDFDRGERVGMRLPVTVPPDKERNFPLHGIAEISVAREGDFEMWMVLFLGARDDTAAAERVLDSFRVTPGPPPEARTGRGFAAAPKDDFLGKPRW